MTGDDLLMVVEATGGVLRWGTFIAAVYCAWRWSQVERY